ncbi:MAG: TraR/DksA C4-type zinc finger protein [Bacteriovoracaceae bacterium]|nr:TraR/DksA C4-type zinc finger protein [Bacteriovoracaceae bacterium]
MDQTTLNQFKLKFVDMLNKLTQEQGQISSDYKSGDVFDRINSEREALLTMKLEGRKSFLVKKIIIALQKIEDGEFGTCTDCGEDISFERLVARPMATKCITCKECEERIETHIPYSKRSHTMGKVIENENAEINLGEEVKGTKTFAFDKSKKIFGLKSVLPA